MGRDHSRVTGINAILANLDSQGNVRKGIVIKDRLAVWCVAVDGERGSVWVGTYYGVLKMTLDGDIVAEIPLNGYSLSVEPDTGCVWVGAKSGLYRLDPDGNLIWSKETGGEGQKWIGLIPEEE